MLEEGEAESKILLYAGCSQEELERIKESMGNDLLQTESRGRQ